MGVRNGRSQWGVPGSEENTDFKIGENDALINVLKIGDSDAMINTDQY